MKVVALKDFLRQRGKKVGGVKADLVKRALLFCNDPILNNNLTDTTTKPTSTTTPPSTTADPSQGMLTVSLFLHIFIISKFFCNMNMFIEQLKI